MSFPLLSSNSGQGEADGETSSDQRHVLLQTEVKHDEEEDLDLIRRYEDFSTVDWIEDSLRERTIRHKAPTSQLLIRLDGTEGILGYLWRLLRRTVNDAEAWLVTSLVGVAIGISAAMISIVTQWMSDIKLGHCSTGWWLSRKFCCLEIAGEMESCAEWRSWGGIEPVSCLVYISFAAGFAFSAAYLVKNFAPYSAGSGISEIKCILGGFIIKGFLSLETFLIKGLTLPLAIASGLALGKEGPSVHVACSIGNVVARLFSRYDRSHLKMREIVTASSAAGVAVAFGSPIGGVLFSIEEMNQNYSNRTMLRSFVCALVATFTLAWVDPFRTGKLVLFNVSYDRDWHYFEIPAYVLIGIFGGLYGAFVIKFNLQVAAFRRQHLSQLGISEAVTLAILTAVVGYFNRFLKIDMTEMLSVLFRECEGGGDHDGLCQSSFQWRMVNSLLLATIIRTICIIFSYGCKVPAGIFVPSMAVGATFGRMIGILVKAMHTSYPTAPWFVSCAPDAPCITPGTYAFLGAAAALGGITRITVTVVVIMFELTGALTYLLPTMIVVLVTKAIGDQFGGGGIAGQMIRFNGYPFLGKTDKEDLTDQAFIKPIEHVMRKNLVIMIASGMPLKRLTEVVQDTNYQGFPVVKSDTDRTVIGFVRKNELRFAIEKIRRLRGLSPSAICTFQYTPSVPENLQELLQKPDIVIPSRQSKKRSIAQNGTESGDAVERIDFGQFVEETVLTVSSRMPLELVMQLFRRMGPRVILVAEQGQLVGLVTVKDVLRHEVSSTHRNRIRTPVAPSNPNYRHSVDSNEWDNDWTNVDDFTGHGLEIIMEKGFEWARSRAIWIHGVAIEVYRRIRGQNNSQMPFDYELNEELT
ncbi:uncharacterized protein L203_102488 [Cryptococcus depauperatus CBS 7841]|uniref:Chloride channel protein n=1 Tax=Cryptococcus depauperatus CBS 7841 TaxID=1295531 RepID=A0AAJ8LZU2_9TREE